MGGSRKRVFEGKKSDWRMLLIIGWSVEVSTSVTHEVKRPGVSLEKFGLKSNQIYLSTKPTNLHLETDLFVSSFPKHRPAVQQVLCTLAENFHLELVHGHFEVLFGKLLL